MDYRFSLSYDNTPADIDGQDYWVLLKTCFHYSSFFCLRYISDLNHYPSELCNSMCCLEPYQMFSVFQLQEPMLGAGCDRFTFYRCTPETLNILKRYATHMFAWNAYSENQKLPEDLIFFRKDGSVFFFQITHEKEAALFPRGRENVKPVVKKRGWRDYKNKALVWNFPLSYLLNPCHPLSKRHQWYAYEEQKLWVNYPEKDIGFYEEMKQTLNPEQEAEEIQNIDKYLKALCKIREDKKRYLCQRLSIILRSVLLLKVQIKK